MSDYDDDNYFGDDVEFDDENDEFDGEDDDDSEGNLMEITYYNAKAEDDVEKAVEGFQLILDMEVDPGEWGFKALKQMIKRQLKANQYDEMTESYKILLERMGGTSISRNDSERAINKVLMLVSVANETKLLSKIYEITLEALKKMKNETLWMNTKLKLGRLYLENNQLDSLKSLIDELKAWCANGDSSKSSHLLEVLVLEIQMVTKSNDMKRLKPLVAKCREVSSSAVVLNPGVIGIIHECGGKMHMKEKLWSQAYSDFFEAFKSYDEAGNSQRIQCLKYLVLAAMLTSNESQKMVNPFDAKEAKSYRDHSAIVPMTRLIEAYERNDITAFEAILRQHSKDILADEFMKHYISDLKRNIRVKVLSELIKPYTRIRLSFLAKALSIDLKEVEFICMDMILDEKLHAHIDQVNSVLIMGIQKGAFQEREKALNALCDQVDNLYRAIRPSHSLVVEAT